MSVYDDKPWLARYDQDQPADITPAYDSHRITRLACPILPVTIVDVNVIIEDVSAGLSLVRVGGRVRAERERRGWSLDQLAQRSRVSRSMIYGIERGQKAPTVLTLDRIATALGTSIARLVETERDDRVILLPHDRQAVARDPSGWERRILSPALPGVEFEFMRATLGPSVDAGTFDPRAPGSREYVAVEAGELELTLDGVVYRLVAGDAIYYAGDCRHRFRNPLARPCIYYLAMDVTGGREARHG
jgi:transcriptional regulator with XRE-family HTH domain